MDEKSKRFERFSLSQREQIEKYLSHGFSCSKIASLIGRGKNSVVVEVRRSGGRIAYKADEAQKKSDERHKRKIESGSRYDNSLLKSLLPQIKSLAESGQSFWQIRCQLKMSYVSLVHAYKLLNMKWGSCYQMIEELQDKIGNLEMQIEILLDFMKGNK